MAHFAQIENNKVVQVLVVGNEDINNLPFPESEPVGVAFLNGLFPGLEWKQTSYNNNFRSRYAGIDYEFRAEYGDHGVFVAPPLYPYFIFDAATCSYIPPVPYPTDGNEYYWSDPEYKWVKIPTVTVIG